ncbi:hypothetical protein V6N12_021004 [Hibiscus sabdariffa]|uniref:Uncharacterized protein n=1 Tax=Hibiscus sabdariffa TaxID=183260 RepID=A0ABR2B211_9ROSI
MLGSRQVTDLMLCQKNIMPAVWAENLPWAGSFRLRRENLGWQANLPDRFTNSAPADAIVAALAGSECHQPGTASVQLPIWL